MRGDQRVERFVDFCASTTTAIWASVTALGIPALLAKQHTTTANSLAISVPIIIITSIIAKFGVDRITRMFVNYIPALRRILYRQEYIEGWWSDVAVIDDTIHEIAIIHIFYQDGEMRLTATIYDCTARRIGKFSSVFSTYDGDKYKFVHERECLRKNQDHESAKGYSEYWFSHDGRHPLTFTGEFSDPEVPCKFEIFGHRILDKQTQKALRSSNADEIKKIVPQIINTYKETLPRRVAFLAAAGTSRVSFLREAS